MSMKEYIFTLFEYLCTMAPPDAFRLIKQRHKNLNFN